MTWKKGGQIYTPPTDNPEMSGWTSYPTALLMDDRIRIFHSPRNRDNQTCITHVDLDRNTPKSVIAEARRPILERGALGTFDDCGVQPMQALWVDDSIYLYYLGWNPALNKLSRNSTGLAISHDGGNSFTRAFEGPVLDRTKEEPYFSFTPWIIREDEIWRMWYATGTAWTMVNEKPEGAFELRDATSHDGIIWQRPNRQILPPTFPDEVMCKPNVIKLNDTYHMWFSYRSYRDFRGGDGSYRIGYARSEDGEAWTRDDTAGGLDVGDEGDWDSEMVCFSSVLKTENTLYLFYNGNGFGQTGFGYAEWNE